MTQDGESQVGAGYAFGQLARAFATATTHESEQTRERAVGRMKQWSSVLTGMASGSLQVGSRKPVADLPSWVTPTVIRGGFATGEPAAGGPLTEWERRTVNRHGLRAKRAEVFAFSVGEDGLTELHSCLQSAEFGVGLPEDAALLVVAWLVGAGESDEARELLATLAPFADRLSFAPTQLSGPPPSREVVWRQTSPDVAGVLERRRPNRRIEAMRESLQIWNPFADEVLTLWLETTDDARVAQTFPAGWAERARDLLAKYDDLARTHTLVTKHRRPGENLAILLAGLRSIVDDGDLSPRTRGWVQLAADSMVRRRGAPGSEQHRGLRIAQAHVASRPSHDVFAKALAHRVASAPEHLDVAALDGLVAPVTPSEAEAFGLPIGASFPDAFSAVVCRALAGTPEDLIARGVIPSAEVLAALVPRIAASVIADGYDDPILGELMASTYEAFRRRRTLLLLNLEHQVRFEELPWVAAVEPHRTRSGTGAASAFDRLAELSLDAFPATITPSPLVSELDVLSREAGLGLPLVEELAADIFMGTFSSKFLRAAQLAGARLGGSLYARYYGIDYSAVRAIDDLAASHADGPKTSAQFDALCRARAGFTGQRYSVAANGTVLEQAQILTTHNLAALASHAELDWAELASRCLARVFVLAARIDHNPRPLRTIKDLAYAWRQMLFFATLSGDGATLLATARGRSADADGRGAGLLTPALDGLQTVLAGGDLDGDSGVSGRRVLGWTTTRHWLLPGDDDDVPQR